MLGDTGTQVLVVRQGKGLRRCGGQGGPRLESADTPSCWTRRFSGIRHRPRVSSVSAGRVDGEARQGVREILQGRVAILCDSSPLALIVPPFVMLLHASADSYDLPLQSLLLRLVRVIGWLVATMAPPYIVVSSFSPGILPPNAVMSIQAARQECRIRPSSRCS